MEIIIDITDDIYAELTKTGENEINLGILLALREAVRQGTPLPKGHGDLKDFQKIYADMTEIVELARQRVIDTPTNSPCYMRYVSQLNERTAFKEMLFDAPTIIKADEEQEE